MAIIDEEATAGYTAPGAPAPAAPAPAPTAAPVGAANPDNQPTGWAFSMMGSMAGLSRSASSEALEKGYAKLKAFFSEKISADVPYAFVPLELDNVRDNSVSLSSILVVAKPKNNDGIVSFHTLVLEGSGDPLPARSENWQGRSISVPIFTTDVFQEFYQQKATDVVRRAFPNASRHILVSHTVVPRDFNWENEEAVRAMAMNAALAAAGDLEKLQPNFMDLTMRNHLKAEKIQARIVYDDTPKMGVDGHPIRADIVATLQAVLQQQSGQYDPGNGQERSQVVAQATGFLDTVWSPTPPPQVPYGYAAPQQRPPLFAPRLVITSLENRIRPTLQGQLLALVTLLPLNENSNWISYFARNAGRAASSTRALGDAAARRSKNQIIDPRDVGALNIEQNLENNPSGYSSVSETKSPNLQASDIALLVRSFYSPSLTISLDIGDGAPDSWINEAFAVASDSQAKLNHEAQQAIIEAADQLTDGRFRPLWGNSDLPVLMTDERYLAGYYRTSDGTRDLRDVDYIAVGNILGQDDPQSMRAWSDTYTRLDIPLNKRLEARMKMIDQVVSGELTFTGRGHRCTFNGRFITVFGQAMMDCGYRHDAVGSMFGTDLQTQRQAAAFITQGAIDNNAGFSLNAASYGGGAASNNTFGGGFSSGRRF